MTLKMKQVTELQNLFDTMQNKILPIKTAYKLSKIKNKTTEEIDFYKKQFTEIINIYALRDDSGQYVYSEHQDGIQIQPKKEKECNQKIEELQNLNVTFPDITFQLDELDSVQLTIDGINALIPFIED